jgi:hypothetical protein
MSTSFARVFSLAKFETKPPMLPLILLGRGRAAVTGILVLRQRRPPQVANLVALAPVHVRHARLQAVDVRPPCFEREVAEHGRTTGSRA